MEIWVAFILAAVIEKSDGYSEFGVLYSALVGKKSNIFYACTEGCARFIFDEASDANFVCPFCQGSLEYMENAKVVEAIERQITDLKACV